MTLFFWFVRILLTLSVVVIGLFLPIIFTVVRSLRDLVSLSFGATVYGPTRFIDRLAGEWTELFHRQVDDRDHIQEVFQLCRILAGATIVLGWVIAGFFTVIVLRIVFGIFI